MRRIVIRAVLLCVFALAISSEATASTISLVGDKDCFGLDGSCPDGTLWRDQLGGVFFTNYQDAGDPAFTDRWDSAGSTTYNHVYTLDGTALAATLQVKTAGLADILGPYNVLFNGTLIGTIPQNVNVNAFQAVVTHNFIVPLALLTGNDQVALAIGTGDGFSIDYSELSVTTSAATAVPEPASMLLLGGGLAALVVRRRWSARA